tara:strand:- start:16 stop:267 length:252 start_codon:yes stop_codon:yes gene_type:complete
MNNKIIFTSTGAIRCNPNKRNSINRKSPFTVEFDSKYGDLKLVSLKKIARHFNIPPKDLNKWYNEGKSHFLGLSKVHKNILKI